MYSFRVTDAAQTKPAADDQWSGNSSRTWPRTATRRFTRSGITGRRCWNFSTGIRTNSSALRINPLRRAGGAWEKLQRDDFRGYLRFLGRQNLGRAAIQLRFCALRTFYKFLIRHGVAGASPIKNLSLPKQGRKLPNFSRSSKCADLLGAPVKLMAAPRRKGPGRPVSASVCLRDVAVLETIYSCGLRVSELCGLRVEDIDWSGQLVRVRGKGKKERLVPIGEPALKAIGSYWST